MTYEIVRYSPNLRPGVIALERHLVSANPELNDAYFRWKHETNPYTREPLVYVALTGGFVAGMRAFLGARWQLGATGKTVFWPCACDFVVDPRHRGAKLFRRIMEFALADLAAQEIGPVLNWSASPITYGASLRTGWRLVGTYATWARRTARARRLREWAERIRRVPVAWRVAELPVALGLRPGFAALDAAWANEPRDATITLSREPRAAEMAAIVEAASTPAIRHVRDTDYYGWRCGNPLSDYRFVYCDRSGLQGFLILRAARLGDAADISIVDWAAREPGTFAALVTQVVECGGYDSLSIWSATLPVEGLACLRDLGLAPDDQSRGIPDYRPGLLAIGPRGSDIHLSGRTHFCGFDRWDLRPLYSDFY